MSVIQRICDSDCGRFVHSLDWSLSWALDWVEDRQPCWHNSYKGCQQKLRGNQAESSAQRLLAVVRACSNFKVARHKDGITIVFRKHGRTQYRVEHFGGGFRKPHGRQTLQAPEEPKEPFAHACMPETLPS